MRKSVALLVVLVLLAIDLTLIPMPVNAAPRTIVVPDDYPTICAAIGNAADGDTVFVKKGTYEIPENQSLVISNFVSLIGEDPKNTVMNLHPRWIEGNFPFTLSYYEDAIRIEASDVRLSGFTINSIGGSILIKGGRIQITGNIITTTLYASGHYQNISLNTLTQGIWSFGSYNNIEENRIIGNGVVMGVGADSNQIHGNNITDCNTETAGYGIRLDNGAHNVFNNIVKNCNHAITVLGESSSNNIYANRVINNVGGLEIFGQGSNNVFHDNYVANNHYGVLLSYTFMRSPGENNTVYHNNFVDNAEQINNDPTYFGNYGSEASTYPMGNYDDGKEGNYWSDYTGTDKNNDGIGDSPYLVDAIRKDRYPLMHPWGAKTIVIPDQYPTIVAAIGNATDGDTIFIESGTYEGPINQTLVIDKSISLIGENVENTTVNLHPKYNVTWIGPVDFYHYSDAMQIDADDVKLANLNLRFQGDMRSSGDRVKIEGNNLWSHSTSARIFINGSYCTFVNNTLLGFINLEGSFNSVAGNNAFGLELQYANRNSVYSNILQTLRLDSSDANTIYGNNVSTEVLWYAIEVHNSHSNTFYENSIEVDLWNTNLRIDNNSSNNTFYNNAFMYDYPNHIYDPEYSDLYNNKMVLVSIESIANSNSWDNGSVGNYWKNYLLKYPTALEIDSSGIGNTPYVIDENSKDYYPLTRYPMNNTPSPSPSPSPTSTQSPEPTSTPKIPEFPSLIILPLFIILALPVTLFYFKKRKS